MGLPSSMAAQEQKPASRVSLHPAALLSLVCASVFVLYIGTARFAFVYDDVYQVLDTAAIHSWSHFFGYFTAPTFATPYYRPLLLTWFRINDALFGGNAAGWHLSSVALHVAVTALVYALARRLGGSTTVALVAALMFGVHPIHIESAAWVSDACDPLAAGFFILAFLAYLRAAEARFPHAWAWKLAAAGGYALALLSKETAVAFPAVIAAFAFIYAEGGWEHRLRRTMVEAAPFVAMTLAYLYLHQALTRSVAVSQANVSATTALLTAPSLVAFYLRKLFVPIGLSAFYDKGYVTSASAMEFVVPLVIVVIAAGAIWAWQRRSRDSRLIAFSGWWLVAALAPALNVQKLPHQSLVHDRYTYLASSGFSILLAVGLEQAVRKLAPRREGMIAQVAIGAGLVLCALNVSQQVFWANDLLLYKRGATIAPLNDDARNNLGRALAERGEFAAAEPIFLDILRRSPDSSVAHYNLGYTYYRQGRYSEAETHLTRAAVLEPGNPFIHLYLGLTAMREGKLELAEREVGQAVRMRPGHTGFHLALGYVLEMKGDLRGALAETRAELANSPGSDAIRQRAAQLEAKLGPR